MDATERKDTERIAKHHGGPHMGATSSPKPYWKRMHHSPFFWISVFFILLAMTVFIMTDGFLLRPRQTTLPVATQP